MGVLALADGAAAFYLRINFLSGTRYGPSLVPVYIIFAGIAVSVVGLALKTVADRKIRKIH